MTAPTRPPNQRKYGEHNIRVWEIHEPTSVSLGQPNGATFGHIEAGLILVNGIHAGRGALQFVSTVDRMGLPDWPCAATVWASDVALVNVARAILESVGPLCPTCTALGKPGVRRGWEAIGDPFERKGVLICIEGHKWPDPANADRDVVEA